MHEEKVLEGLVCDIYNRCSTTEEAQNRAIEVQAEESRELVLKMGGIIYKQYIEQESGTSTRKRDRYAELLSDVSNRRVDCIVVKSIDRLMRNAGDWHEFIQLITACGVRLYLYLERKFYEPEDAFLSGIKALIAEQYSRELSQKVNNAHKRRQRLENGKLTLVSHVYGYEKRNGEFVINELEAEYIRKIFFMSANGIGSRIIAREIKALGLRSRSGGDISDVTIRRIIKNPLYMGTVVMNKTHYDFERKKTIYNPKDEWIYHKDRVPAIIDEELWQAANSELEKRKAVSQAKDEMHGLNISDEKCISGKLYCGICNKPFYKRVSASGKEYFICSGQQAGKCRNIAVYEDELFEVLKQILIDDSKSFRKLKNSDIFEQQIRNLLELLENVLSSDTSEQMLFEKKEKELAIKKKRLLKKLVDEIISDKDYCLMNDELEKQHSELIKSRRQVLACETDSRQRLEQIEKFLSDKNTKVKIFKIYLLQYIDSICVEPEGKLKLLLKGNQEAVNIPYRHQNKKTLQKEEKTEQIYRCIKEAGKLTAAQLSDITGLSVGNVSLKLKELKNKNKICFVSQGRNGGYWKPVD